MGPSHWSEQTCVYVRGEAGLDKVILGPQMRRYHILNCPGSQVHEQLDWFE